jgi:hypothetical protein
MSLLQLEMYDALKAAGTPEPEAREAAKVAADADTRLISMAERLNGIDSKLTLVIGVMLVGFGAMLTAFWQVFLRLPR